MKRCALAAALLAAIGLNVGCGGGATEPTPPAETPQSDAPPVEGDTGGDTGTGAGDAAE